MEAKAGPLVSSPYCLAWETRRRVHRFESPVGEDPLVVDEEAKPPFEAERTVGVCSASRPHDLHRQDEAIQGVSKPELVGRYVQPFERGFEPPGDFPGGLVIPKNRRSGLLGDRHPFEVVTGEPDRLKSRKMEY